MRPGFFIPNTRASANSADWLGGSLDFDPTGSSEWMTLKAALEGPIVADGTTRTARVWLDLFLEFRAGVPTPLARWTVRPPGAMTMGMMGGDELVAESAELAPPAAGAEWELDGPWAGEPTDTLYEGDPGVWFEGDTLPPSIAEELTAASAETPTSFASLMSTGHPFFTDGDLVLDGRPSFHEWSRPMTRFRWVYWTSTRRIVLARGITAVVPRALWNLLRVQSGVVCLHVTDADRRSDFRCWGPNSTLPPPPDTINPNARQQIGSQWSSWKFHRILETSGLASTMDTWTGFTVLLPHDNTIPDATFDQLMAGPQSARQQFVLDHVIRTAPLTRAQIQGAGSLTLASGRTLAITPAQLASRITFPDHRVAGNAIVHVLEGRVPVL